MLRNAFLFAFFAMLFGSCSDKKEVKPTIILVETDASNGVNCFGQNRGLDTINAKDDKKLKRYFNSMVPVPSRSSLFVKRD